MVVGTTAEEANPGRAVFATGLFVLGFTIVFAGLGVAAGSLGSSLDHIHTALERGGGLIVAIMGLVLLGVLRGPRRARAARHPQRAEVARRDPSRRPWHRVRRGVDALRRSAARRRARGRGHLG